MSDVTHYALALICSNGHIINDRSNYNPQRNANYCNKCGAPAIKKCQKCNAEIKGSGVKITQGFTGEQYCSTVHPLRNAPSYCPNCGEPYPWTENKIKAAIQIFAEFGDLDNSEKETIESDIKNISKDVPETELSARRIKKIWNKGKAFGYEAIMEFASRTAAKVLSDKSC